MNIVAVSSSMDLVQIASGTKFVLTQQILLQLYKVRAFVIIFSSM